MTMAWTTRWCIKDSWLMIEAVTLMFFLGSRRRYGLFNYMFLEKGGRGFGLGCTD